MCRLLPIFLLLPCLRKLNAVEDIERITFELIRYFEIREVIWVCERTVNDSGVDHVKYFSVKNIPIAVIAEAKLVEFIEAAVLRQLSIMIVFQIISLKSLRDLFKMIQNVKKHHLISDFTWVIYLDGNESVDFRNDLQELPVPYDCEFIIIQKISTKYELIEFYTVLNQAAFALNFASWDKDAGLQTTKKSYYERRENLKNITLTYAKQPERNPKKPCHGGGYISCAKRDLLEDVQRMMKFNIKVVRKTRERDDGPEYADIYDSQSLIHSYSFDFDVFGPLYKLDHNWYIKDPKLTARDDFFILPFAPELWLSVLVTIIGSTFIIITIGALTNYQKRTQFMDNLFLALECFSNQDGGEGRTATSFRIASITLRVVALFIIPSYSAVIISFLAVRLPRLPFRTLEQFAANGKYYMVRKDGALFPQLYFEESADPTVKLINSKYMKVLSEEEGMNVTCKGGHAIVAPNIFRKNPPCKYYQILKPLAYAFTGLPLSKHSPFRATFNHNLIRIYSSGIQWRMQEKINDVPLKDLAVDEFLPVTFSQMQIVFCFLPLAVGISIIVYFLELMCNVCKKVRSRHKNSRSRMHGFEYRFYRN